MRVLITNDDGIEAPGIHTLRRIAEQLTDDIWLVAPTDQQSCKSHSVTVDAPVRIRHYEEKIHAVAGTPADCVFIALSEIMRDCPPDLVLSGINHGSNYGSDIIYSGTVAAAREAVLRGVPAIAFSYRYNDRHNYDWSAALKFGPTIAKKIIDTGIPPRNLLNVNFPGCAAEQVKGIKVVPAAKRNSMESILKRTDPYESDYYWLCCVSPSTDEEPETDVAAIYEHYISVTPIQVNLTNRKLLEAYRSAFEGFEGV